MSKSYLYYIVDVFTRQAFGGNQLAVLPQAQGISAQGMQRIAREFNFAESTFVLPARNPAHTCQVRIFTPATEMAFAGHPTVGTACALAKAGSLGAGANHSLVFEEQIGPVPVEVGLRDGLHEAHFTLDQGVKFGDKAMAHSEMASILSLSADQIKATWFASCGAPFCFVQLASRQAVDWAQLDMVAWKNLLAQRFSPSVYLFSGDLVDQGSLYARMFAPAWGVNEDPATGSAAAALIGSALERLGAKHSELALQIEQGVAMGRPSVIKTRSWRRAEGQLMIQVGGASVWVGEGTIEVPDDCLGE